MQNVHEKTNCFFYRYHRFMGDLPRPLHIKSEFSFAARASKYDDLDMQNTFELYST